MCAGFALGQASGPASGPADDVEYWLNKAAPTPASAGASSRPAAGIPEKAAGAAGRPSREDALPGVVELSDGKILAGYLYTTAEKDWSLYVEDQKRWVNIPFLSVLSITAEADEEKMEQEWRWKEMGVPERVYTGKQYPTRRLRWKFHLIDDTTLTGTIKGQPLWVESGHTQVGPLVLHERSKGTAGQTMAELVYPRRIIVSRRLMETVAGGR